MNKWHEVSQVTVPTNRIAGDKNCGAMCLSGLFQEPPTSREGVSCGFWVVNLTPATIAQVSMGKFVSDYVKCEIFSAISQSGFQDDASAAITVRTWAG